MIVVCSIFHINPFGTEPLYRVFTKGTTEDIANHLSKIGTDLINKAMEKSDDYRHTK